MLSKEKKAEHIEKMYGFMQNKNPRLTFKFIARRLKIYCKTASRTYKDAITEEKLYPPMLRLKICTDYKEYVYIINARNSKALFDKLRENPHIEYMVCCKGEFDLLIITNERIDLIMEDEFRGVLLSGERDNYIYPSVKRGDYQIIFKEIDEFLKRKEFIPSKIITEIGERGNEWLEREEKLFRYLKEDVRRKFTTIERQLGINRSLLLVSYAKVRKHTSVVVPYYPKGYSDYIGFYLVMQTKYEEQAIDLFGKLPCHSAFFKVKDYLIGYINVEKNYIYELYTLLLNLPSSTFVDSLIFSVSLCFYSRD